MAGHTTPDTRCRGRGDDPADLSEAVGEGVTMGLREDIDRMTREDAAATPGPWDEDGIERMLRLHDQPPGNGAFIASARTDRPALVELVRIMIARDGEADHILDAMWAEAKRKAGAR